VKIVGGEKRKNTMRKVNLITTLSLTVVMLAMMAIPAMGNPAEIDIKPDGTIDLVPESWVETTAHLYEMVCDGSPRTLHVNVVEGISGDLTFKVVDREVNPEVTTPESVGGIEYKYQPSAGTTEYDITVMIKAEAGTQGDDYTLYFEDIQSGKWDKASASVPLTAVPEFTTIAIPVASILGLLFYFNHRKRRKE
jgi:hypothetical protein